MATRALPRRRERGAERGFEASGLGQIRQQSGTSVPDHASAIGRDDKPGTRPCSVHLEILRWAFLL